MSNSDGVQDAAIFLMSVGEEEDTFDPVAAHQEVCEGNDHTGLS